MRIKWLGDQGRRRHHRRGASPGARRSSLWRPDALGGAPRQVPTRANRCTLPRAVRCRKGSRWPFSQAESQTSTPNWAKRSSKPSLLALPNRPSFCLAAQISSEPSATFSASSLPQSNEKSATRRCQEAIPIARAASRTRCAKSNCWPGGVPKGLLNNSSHIFVRKENERGYVAITSYIVTQRQCRLTSRLHPRNLYLKASCAMDADANDSPRAPPDAQNLNPRLVECEDATWSFKSLNR